ncbi:MAG TPA: NUDIX hydrolase [bacterium]|nr:NUDIX hydrolase [bacterium]
MKIPENISPLNNGQYCIECFHNEVERIFENNKTFYHCTSCQKTFPRSLVIDNAITSWIEKDGTYWHESVGVIIKNKEKQVFCIARDIYPFAHALPAGHLDAGENPRHAAEREVKEEIGIQLPELKFIGRFPISGDECRRGCDDHMWNLFVTNKPDDFQPKLSDEASSALWLSKDELLNRDDVVYPLRYVMQHFESEIFLVDSPPQSHSSVAEQT